MKEGVGLDERLTLDSLAAPLSGEAFFVTEEVLQAVPAVAMERETRSHAPKAGPTGIVRHPEVKLRTSAVTAVEYGSPEKASAQEDLMKLKLLPGSYSSSFLARRS